MAIVLHNNSKGILSTALGVGVMTFNVGPGEGSEFAECTATDHMWLTIVTQASYGTDSEEFEIVRVSPRSGDTFTITARAQEGTTERAFGVKDIVEQRTTSQTLRDLGGGSDKPRAYLDEFYLSMIDVAPFPDEATFLTFNTRYASNVLGLWDSFWGSRVKVQIEDLTRNIIHDAMSFPTVASMLVWITANVTGNADQTIIARPYETIDEKIPVQTKLFGLNRFFSSLRGRRKYTSAMNATAKNALAHAEAMAELFNTIWETSFTSGTLDMDAVWLGRATKNLYTNPKFRVQWGCRIDLQNGSQDRTVWDSATSSWTGALVDVYTNEDKERALYIALHNDGTSWEIFEMTGENWKIVKLMREGYSILMAQGVSLGTHVAIYLKPLGIDQVVLQMPDFSKYDLEMVFFNHRRQGFINVQVFSDLGDFVRSTSDFADPSGAKLRLNSYEWLAAPPNNRPALVPEGSFTNDFNWDTVRFRLRDKTTKEVSNLSYAGIVTEANPKKEALKKMAIKSFHDKG